MSHSDPSVSNVLSQEVKHETHTRLQGPWLILARLGWGVFVMLTLGLFFLSMPGYYHRLRTLSSSVVYDPNVVRVGLAHLGLFSRFLCRLYLCYCPTSGSDIMRGWWGNYLVQVQ